MMRPSDRVRCTAALFSMTVAAAFAQPVAPTPDAPPVIRIVGSRAAPAAPLPTPKEAARKKDRPAGEQPILPPAFPEGLEGGVPVTLTDVLRLAIVANLDIEQARVAVERARLGISRAGARFLPNVALGGLFTTHEGRIQNTLGNISDVNRDSLFVGFNSTFVVGLSDVLYALPEARSLLTAARFGQTTVMNDTLLRVAEAYFNVLRARRQLARLDETIEFLTSEEESELRARSKGLLPLIKAFVRAGTALPSDQTRVEADLVRRTAERARVLEDVRTASAELTRLLHLDPAYFLLPADDYRHPVPLPGEGWCGQCLETLVAQALRARPELSQNAALIDAALARYRQAQWRPLLPYVIANASFGGFGGGPRTPGRTVPGGEVIGSSDSGVITDFGTRTDIDLGLQWRLDGLGLGDLYRARDRRLEVQQAQLRQLQIQDLVVSQVVSSSEQVRRGRERVAISTAGLFDAGGSPTGVAYRSLRLNFLRIKGGQGLPLEVLDSTRRLNDVLQAYADGMSDYDRARMRLLVALGMPTAALLDPEKMPLPPSAVAPSGAAHGGGRSGALE